MKKSKLYSLLLSVVIAFGLWLYVITSVSPDSTETYYNIPVALTGESVLNENGLMITSTSTSTVSLELAGSRSYLSKINSGNITVTADLSTIYEPGQKIALEYKIAYPGDVPKNAFEELSRSDFYVNVEKRVNKEVPVQIVWTGTRSEDHLYDTENAVLDYATINVIGPASVADLIHHATIEIDLTDRVESLSESYRYTLCDAEGNPVDAAEITTNVEEVRVDMKIQRIKELKLVADVIYGGGATRENTVVEVSPLTIRVSGSDAVLAELGDTLTIATIDLSAVEKATEQPYSINLPEGVINQTGVNEATAAIRFAGLMTREFTVENIQSTNVPEGLEADIINATMTVKVRGPAAEINKLTAEDISVTVDFSNAVEGTSTYKATILFGEDFSNVGAIMGPYSVSATVQNTED